MTWTEWEKEFRVAMNPEPERDFPGVHLGLTPDEIVEIAKDMRRDWLEDYPDGEVRWAGGQILRIKAYCAPKNEAELNRITNSSGLSVMTDKIKKVGK